MITSLPLLASTPVHPLNRSCTDGVKEFKLQHHTAADAVPKAGVTTQVLPDRGVVFRLLAPGARQVSTLVGFSNPQTVTTPSYPLKKDDQGLWSTTIGPLAPGVHEVQLHRFILDLFAATI